MRGSDPINLLTLAELDEANRKLKADVLSAIHEGTVDRFQALAIVAWMLKRRDDPTVRLDDVRQLSAADVNELFSAGTEDEETDPAADPTESAAAS